MYSILTKREREVYELLIRNHSTQEIARCLGISEKTVPKAGRIHHSLC